MFIFEGSSTQVLFVEGAPHTCDSTLSIHCYNNPMQRKVFWMTFAVVGLIADVALPFWWALFATIPIGMASWWIAYRSEWF